MANLSSLSLLSALVLLLSAATSVAAAGPVRPNIVLIFTDDQPQFSMGKSFATFGPIGPAIVSLDALADAGDIELWCELDGERMQHGRTSDLIFGLPALVAYLSSICELYPGDLIFTGTPAGVGFTRQPARFLADGELLVSHFEGIGTLRNPVRRP